MGYLGNGCMRVSAGTKAGVRWVVWTDEQLIQIFLHNIQRTTYLAHVRLNKDLYYGINHYAPTIYRLVI